MARLHRETIIYWWFIAVAGAFSLFGAFLVPLMLSDSMRGRIRGGVSLNVIATVLVLLWAWMVASFDVALWSLRNVPAEIQIISLGRGRRPEDPVVAAAWRWTRAAWLAFLSFMALLFATAFIAWVFDPWRDAV
jgi:hypothetical protein